MLYFELNTLKRKHLLNFFLKNFLELTFSLLVHYTKLFNMPETRCYRCRKKGHRSSDCPLPEGLCAVCHKGGHNRHSCQYGSLSSLPVEIMYHILSFLTFNERVGSRLISKYFEEVIGSLFGKQEFLDFKLKEILNRFLETEVFFQNFKTKIGKKILIFKLTDNTFKTPVGKANLWKYKLAAGFSDKPMSEEEYLSRFPDQEVEDYIFWKDIHFSCMVEEAKLTLKMEVKALKAMFKYLSLKYASKYNINYPDQMADRKKYEVVFSDKPFFRRVISSIIFVTEKAWGEIPSNFM